MDEHKTPEEIINDNAAPDAPETDAPEACAQPEEVTAGEPAAVETDTAEVSGGEADAAEVPAPAEKKPMSVRARHALQRGVAGLLAAIRTAGKLEKETEQQLASAIAETVSAFLAAL